MILKINTRENFIKKKKFKKFKKIDINGNDYRNEWI